MYWSPNYNVITDEVDKITSCSVVWFGIQSYAVYAGGPGKKGLRSLMSYTVGDKNVALAHEFLLSSVMVTVFQPHVRFM